MSTSLQVITKFTSFIYPDCSAAQARSLFDDAHREIMTRIPLRTTELTFNFVNGQREYAIGEGTFDISWAAVDYSATNTVPLQQTTISDLDARYPTWRATQGQNPQKCYLVHTSTTGGTSVVSVGIDSVPTADASGGYPRIRLSGTQHVTLADGDSLPPGLLNDEAHLMCMARAYARRNDRGAVQGWEQQYEATIAQNVTHATERMKQTPATGFIPVGMHQTRNT
jgi:hypothetical protein